MSGPNDMRLELQSFRTNICDGFVRYQQNGDFVDMTIAAEGHLVKVHKNIMSLSSPYIEEMLKTVPCKHPVLFLSNITHDILVHVLEYVYTGATNVPRHKFEEFKAACKHLHIIGIRDFQDTSWLTTGIPKKSVKLDQKALEQQTGDVSTIPMPTVINSTNENTNCDIPMISIDDNEFDMNIDTEPQAEGFDSDTKKTCPSSETPTITTSKNGVYQIDLSHFDLSNNDPQPVAKFNIIPEAQENTQSRELVETIPGSQMPLNLINDNPSSINYTPVTLSQYANEKVLPTEMSEKTAPDQYSLDTVRPENTEDPVVELTSNDEQENDNNACTKNYRKSCKKGKPLDIDMNVLYMLSNRGAVQLVLNRFMYSMHHKAFNSRMRRWRCIDYRHKKCNAYIDTDCENITGRAFAHNHGFHDEEILKKGRKGTVFTTLSTAIAESLNHRSNN